MTPDKATMTRRPRARSAAVCCADAAAVSQAPTPGAAGGGGRDEQVQATVEAALREGGGQAAGLTYADVERVLEGRDLDMTVEMPSDE